MKRTRSTIKRLPRFRLAVILICVTFMQTKNKLRRNARRAATILEEHFATLSAEQENKARKELNTLARTVSGRARGKASRSGQSEDSRPLSRSCANTA